MERFFDLASQFVVIGVPALVAWVWALWRSHHDLRLKVAEEYIHREALKEFKEDLHQVRTLVFAIARRLEIPTAHDY